MNLVECHKKSIELRKGIVEVCYQSKSGHIGGSLSAIDLLNFLYHYELNVTSEMMDDPNRDRFILSKGHVAESLFVTLADCNFFPKSDLATFSQFQSNYIGHPNKHIHGIEMNTGSLGHGLSLGVGCALAAKLDEANYRTYVLMGDGELAEGSSWEAGMAAANYELDNLVLIIDRNDLQISGPTESVMKNGDLVGKWQTFGFEVLEIDGHDYRQIATAFQKARGIKKKPTCIIAHTIKGKGISFMENQVAWHHGVLTQEEYHQALSELEENHHE